MSTTMHRMIGAVLSCLPMALCPVGRGHHVHRCEDGELSVVRHVIMPCFCEFFSMSCRRYAKYCHTRPFMAAAFARQTVPQSCGTRPLACRAGNVEAFSRNGAVPPRLIAELAPFRVES